MRPPRRSRRSTDTSGDNPGRFGRSALPKTLVRSSMVIVLDELAFKSDQAAEHAVAECQAYGET